MEQSYIQSEADFTMMDLHNMSTLSGSMLVDYQKALFEDFSYQINNFKSMNRDIVNLKKNLDFELALTSRSPNAIVDEKKREISERRVQINKLRKNVQQRKKRLADIDHQNLINHLQSLIAKQRYFTEFEVSFLEDLGIRRQKEAQREYSTIVEELQMVETLLREKRLQLYKTTKKLLLSKGFSELSVFKNFEIEVAEIPHKKNSNRGVGVEVVIKTIHHSKKKMFCLKEILKFNFKYFWLVQSIFGVKSGLLFHNSKVYTLMKKFDLEVYHKREAISRFGTLLYIMFTQIIAFLNSESLVIPEINFRKLDATILQKLGDKSFSFMEGLEFTDLCSSHLEDIKYVVFRGVEKCPNTTKSKPYSDESYIDGFYVISDGEDFEVIS